MIAEKGVFMSSNDSLIETDIFCSKLTVYLIELFFWVVTIGVIIK